MKKMIFPVALLASCNSFAAQLDIQIANLTRGSWFTPVLVAAHSPGNSLFSTGSPASANLQIMAEGGDISGLAADLGAINASIVENPAAGLLAPGRSTSASINTDAAPDNTQLSIVAMLLPSNDGFMGLNAIDIPTEPGTYIYNVPAYDAGTEANDEIVGSGAPGEPGYPAPPPIAEASGTGGTGVASSAENFVHIHRNVLGDTDPAGGSSDIDASVHRWLNPVVRVVVTVSE
jgi:Spondin_N